MSLKVKLPKQPIIGTVALREAAAGDFGDIANLIRPALKPLYCQGHNRDCWLRVEYLSSDVIVVKADGRYYQHGYTLSDDNKVTLETAVEVTKDFQPVKTPFTESKNSKHNSPELPAGDCASGAFLEAKDDSGTRWMIRVIDAGVSLNKTNYPVAVLREAVPLFDGARVFVKADQEHIKGGGKSFNNLVGMLSKPTFVEANGKQKAGINAEFTVLKSAGDVPAKLKEAYENKMTSLFGFSIDADGNAKKVSNLREATKITKVNSVDLIIEPGAGGQIVKLLEAVREDDDMGLRTTMIEAVKTANKGKLPAGLDVDNDADLEVAYREAIATGSKKPAAESPAFASKDDVTAAVAMVEVKASMREAVAGSTLPQQAKDKIKADFMKKDSFVEADVTTAIKNETDYLASFTESGKVNGMGEVRITEGRHERVADMMDDLFDPNKRAVRSMRECYIQITGDANVTGDLKNANPAKLREALGDTGFHEALDSSAWSNVLGDAITRRMQADYNQDTQYDVWRQMVTVVPVNDFRTQERVQFGGYGDLPIVAESGDYLALNSPTDFKATYAAEKRGGIEKVTLEMIKNDDMGAILRIPTRLSRSAKRTLAKFVLDFPRVNAAIFDTKALFHVDHNNLGTATLSKAALAAGRLAMLKQAERDSNDPLGIGPVSLWCAPDGEEGAVDLFRRNTENDANFIQSLSLNVIPVWYWTDVNDWVLTADANEMPLIELGFMDGNEEPELFVQDAPTVGSLFSNDQITYKMRHVYGGGVMDYRGFYKGVVA